MGQSHAIEGVSKTPNRGCPVARIVIEVSDQNNSLVLAVQELVALVERLQQRSSGGKPIDYAKIEREVGVATAKVERSAHHGLLAGLDIDAEKVVIGGDVYTRVERCEGPYHTLAGTIRVLRSLYRRNGERNAKVVDAISLRAGVVADGWLPQTAPVATRCDPHSKAIEPRVLVDEVMRELRSALDEYAPSNR